MELRKIISTTIKGYLNEAHTTEDYKDMALDYLINKYGSNKTIVYHGSDDITYFKNVADIDTLNNTKNAKSKYIFVNNKPSVAINYAKNYNGFSEKSGVIVFKLNGRGYIMKNTDIPIAFKSIVDFELFLDMKKDLGFDFVKIPQDGNNIAVLNNSVLTVKEILQLIK
jgi:hypothetical protein